MSVRKAAIRAGAQAGPQQNKRKTNRVFMFLVLTTGAGALAELIALLAPGMVSGAGELVTILQGNSPVQIEASTLFPPVPPQHKTVDVYDPAPARSSAPVRPTTAPSNPSPSPSPRRSPRPTPSGSPPPDD
jgi:hypothetical protein